MRRENGNEATAAFFYVIFMCQVKGPSTSVDINSAVFSYLPQKRSLEGLLLWGEKKSRTYSSKFKPSKGNTNIKNHLIGFGSRHF